ncbi:MAG: hypothetical protein P8R54_14065 [Myxococcota bacterium]|nr:hypothetical protein [Myxococcota bacterium]
MPGTGVEQKKTVREPSSEVEFPSLDTIEDPLAKMELIDPLLLDSIEAAWIGTEEAPLPSIRVEGRGALQGMFITKGMKQLPGSWFDGSDQAEAFRTMESDLGKGGMLDQDGTELADRIAENLRNPIKTDITVRFSEGDSGTEVTISGPEGTQTLAFDMDTAQSMSELDAFIQDIIDTLKGMTGSGRKTEAVS